jgi:hypothetical protein
LLEGTQELTQATFREQLLDKLKFFTLEARLGDKPSLTTDLSVGSNLFALETLFQKCSMSVRGS